MSKVDIYTDGACSGNPGPGGWSAILVLGAVEKELYGFESDTTNNRMELLAAIKGLSALRKPCEVVLYSDSAYLIDAFEKGWLKKWQKNNWRKSDKSAVLNKDLWERLLTLTDTHKVSWGKVKGHSGHEYNERCDTLARKAITENRDRP